MLTTDTARRPAGDAARRRPVAQGRSRLTRHRQTARLIGLTPGLALLVLFLGVPLGEAVRLSLTSWSGAGDAPSIGLANYAEALNDPAFRQAITVTVVYAVGSAAGILLVAVALAASVSANVPGSPFYRIVWFLPGIAPATAVAVFWGLSFAPQTGVVNVLLGDVGLGDMHAWLASPDTAIYPVIGVTIWAGAGFAFLVILGAMEQVPVSLYEAATLDGAKAFRRFTSVTVPLIRPVLVVVAMLELIWAANGFSFIYAMTSGGPGDATTTLPVLIYKQAFQFTRYGYASALGVLSAVVLIVIGAISLRLSASRQDVR